MSSNSFEIKLGVIPALRKHLKMSFRLISEEQLSFKFYTVIRGLLVKTSSHFGQCRHIQIKKNRRNSILVKRDAVFQNWFSCLCSRFIY